ncbi:MAG: ATP-binding protein, partial [Deltaproteobacteria bacterium]
MRRHRLEEEQGRRSGGAAPARQPARQRRDGRGIRGAATRRDRGVARQLAPALRCRPPRARAAGDAERPGRHDRDRRAVHHARGMATKWRCVRSIRRDPISTRSSSSRARHRDLTPLPREGNHCMATTPPTPRLAPVPAPAPRPAGATTAAKPKSRLGAIQRGRLRVPLRHLFYGPCGVGKTSLGADAPNPLFLDVEGGSPQIDVARYPFRDEPGGHVPRVYEDVTAAVEDLIANPGHGYESLVIDTADALESLIHEFVCRRDGKANIEAYGYGKGYKVALVEIRALLGKLDQLINRGMAIIILAHSDEKTFKNPRGPDYDRYRPELNELTWGKIAAWCDVLGFIDFEGGGAALKGDEAQTKRARGWSTGRRIIQLAPDAAVPDAKCRLSLPADLELGVEHPWAPFAAARVEAGDATVATLTADIFAEVDRITGGDREAEFVTAAGTQTSFTVIQALTAKSDASVL